MACQETYLTVQVNGEAVAIGEGTTVSGLVAQLKLTPERLAIELNHKIIRRAEWDAMNLAHGDRVEIVHFVGGG